MSRVLSLLLLGCLFVSCSGELPPKHWSKAVPRKSPAVIVPPQGQTLNQTLSSGYIPFLDDITSSALQLVGEIDTYPDIQLDTHALFLYPGAMDRMQPVWLVEAPDGFIHTLDQAYHKKFTQTQYRFQGVEIQKLFLQERTLFASQVHNLLLLSESSLGIEDALRAYQQRIPALEMAADSIPSGSLILNTPSLDRWVQQYAKTSYRPIIKNLFNGLRPAVLSITDSISDGRNEYRITGTLPIDNDGVATELVAALSERNSPITLDRYISSNAALFGIFRLKPRMAPPTQVSDTSSLDSLLINQNARYGGLARTLDSEFAVVAYAQSGFLSTGEHLIIRKLADRDGFMERLRDLQREGYVQSSGGSFFIESNVLSRMIGSEMATFSDFFLDVTGDVVVISKRKGLAELVEADRSRRRVIYYEPEYLEIRRSYPDSLSFFFMANTDFYNFVEPFLGPDHNLTAFTPKFDQLTMTLQRNPGNHSLDFNLRTYTREENDRPYREKWLFPTGGARISGTPVLSNLLGSPRDEIIFATENGSLHALATDGTSVMQANTDNDIPVGSPVVYDWYGTNQNVVLLAAGNKIYGWNDTGEALPRFPFELSENITTPLTIADIDQNGLPEVIVATADRKIHALNGRGDDIQGWPVSVNARVDNKPLVTDIRGENALVSFAQNAVHAWNAAGSPLDGYPKFMNASLRGSPAVYRDHILANAADGNLYAIGESRLFADSLNVYSTNDDSLDYEAIYISNSALTGTPSVHSNLAVTAGDQTYRENMILTLSANGSVFLINENGNLRFTQSMGQPSAGSFSPFITDLNRDGEREAVALGGFGRLYAWGLRSGDRLFTLPTNDLQHPVVADIDADGAPELIARTNEGLRAWTIFTNQ